MRKWIRKIFCKHNDIRVAITVMDYATKSLERVAPMCVECGKIFNYLDLTGGNLWTRNTKKQ